MSGRTVVDYRVPSEIYPTLIRIEKDGRKSTPGVWLYIAKDLIEAIIVTPGVDHDYEPQGAKIRMASGIEIDVDILQARWLINLFEEVPLRTTQIDQATEEACLRVSDEMLSISRCP